MFALAPSSLRWSSFRSSSSRRRLQRPNHGPTRSAGLCRSLEHFAARIRDGVAAGELRPDVRPETAALGALGMVNGVAGGSGGSAVSPVRGI